jgi:hypothetical protein
MDYFPQLSSGALGQYPITRRRIARTVVNECPDGTQIRLSDPQACLHQWELKLSSITTEEWQAIAALFTNTEGGLTEFVFLDPTDNLLRWSEDLTAGAWSKDAAVTLTATANDPLGTQCATRLANTGQASQRIQQLAAVPAQFQYCFSVYARNATTAEATLFQSAGANSIRTTFALGPQWGRLVLPCKQSSTEEAVSFGIQLDAGAEVDVFGFQVEAQPGASAYKKTTDQSGVYPNARFQDDWLYTTTTGVEQHACVLRIVTHVGGQS